MSRGNFLDLKDTCSQLTRVEVHPASEINIYANSLDTFYNSYELMLFKGRMRRNYCEIKNELKTL